MGRRSASATLALSALDADRARRRRAAMLPRLARYLLLAALLAMPAAHALPPARPLGEFSLDAWTTRDGLPHNLIHAIAQTPDGYLWFGTWEGLVRFNGREFKVFDRASVPELRDNGVRAIEVGRDGVLWLGTSRGGLVRYDGHAWENYGREAGLPTLEVLGLLEDDRGRLWIGSENRGAIVREANGRTRIYDRSSGLPNDTVNTLAQGRDGAIWVGTNAGVSRIDDAGVRTWGTAEGLPKGAVNAVAADADGTVWIGTAGGPYRIEGGRAVAATAGPWSRGNNPSLMVDRAGTVWVGSVAEGVVRVEGATESHLTVEDGLPNARVSALFEDREGSLWIGTNGGLARLKDAPFTTYTTDDGLPDNYVRAVTADRAGTLWVGTSRGLASLRDGRWQTLGKRDGLASDSVLSLLAARDGRLWVGSYGAGLSVVEDGRIEVLDTLDGLPGAQIRAIVEDPGGTIWVGTSDGLLRLGGGQPLRRYGSSDGLPRDYVLSLHVAADGVVWIGTTHGLARIVGDRPVVPREPILADVRDVFGMTEAGGHLWFATDRGLLRHVDGGYSQVSSAQGLPFDTIFQMVEDGHGHFWLTGNRGIVRVALDELEAAADGRLARINAVRFGEADGMASSQCNGSSQPTAWRRDDGSLWFATARGVAVLGPDYLQRGNYAAPPVVIEDIYVDDAGLPLQPRIELVPGTRKLEFRFAGLSYLTPQRLRYRYRLDGFDEDWVLTRAQRSAQYTNLAPGQYRFAVSAAQDGGEWGAQEAVVQVRLLPHYWQTAWFALAAGVLLLVAAWLLFRWRTTQLRARQVELSAQVEARTRDLEAQTERLREADRDKSALLERLREQSEAFERQARSDALTGLANRRQFDARFAEAFERCRRDGVPIVAALVDVDHFKRINDRYSHAAGDAVLRALAPLLSAAAGADGLAARYGGEEFALAFPGRTLAMATDACEALRAAVERLRFEAIDPDLRVTISVGVCAQADAPNHERLLAAADRNLYLAKDGGRNRLVG